MILLSNYHPLCQIGPDGKPLDGGGTPRVKGYAYCATPSIEPGVDASPLMTWGTIEGTPERVPTAPPTPGRAFRMPKVRAVYYFILRKFILCI